jgi:hypothetical protein
VYLNLLHKDISEDAEEFILASLREINEDFVYLEELQEEVLNGNKDNSFILEYISYCRQGRR